MELFETIKLEARKYFVGSDGCHDFEHTMRVYNLCMHIGKTENADLDILSYAAILHDIARQEQDAVKGKICHAERGGEIAKELLKKHGFPEDKILKITHCIETHRSRGSKIPVSKEAQILYDSDKLDGIGAVGIGRAFMFAQNVGAKLHNEKGIDIEKTKAYSEEDTAYREFVVKLRKVKDKLMTKEGKRLAEERHEFMIEFFERLNQETQGEL